MTQAPRSTRVPTQAQEEVPARGVQVLALTVTVLFAVAYVSGVLVPYYVNDLDAFTLAEVSGGGHDPRDMWPWTAGYAGELLHMAGVYAVLLSLPVLVPIGIAALIHRDLYSESSLRHLWPDLLTLAIIITLVALQLSPFGRALFAWTMD